MIDDPIVKPVSVADDGVRALGACQRKGNGIPRVQIRVRHPLELGRGEVSLSPGRATRDCIREPEVEYEWVADLKSPRPARIVVHGHCQATVVHQRGNFQNLVVGRVVVHGQGHLIPIVCTPRSAPPLECARLAMLHVRAVGPGNDSLRAHGRRAMLVEACEVRNDHWDAPSGIVVGVADGTRRTIVVVAGFLLPGRRVDIPLAPLNIRREQNPGIVRQNAQRSTLRNR